mmetsp:Transcript_16801/g.31847  ORF Transcript_16801/g.31847 Transcript_16801/m.31847 type:complete len:229 (-) Transcript_16801:453-1139(-)
MSESKAEPVVVRQLFEKESWTYTYIVGCPTTKKCCLIDPVDLTWERDLAVVDKMGYKLEYCLNTHVHADHITGSGLIKKARSEVKSVISEASGAIADIKLKDKGEIKVGNVTIAVRATPGHTPGCVTYVVGGGQPTVAFCGDTLLINGCGRTDFQGGNPAQLYDSCHKQLFSLPDTCLLYPAHDYNGLTVTTVGEEKKSNPRLTKTKEGLLDLRCLKVFSEHCMIQIS